MKAPDNEYVYPCPISKNFGLPSSLAWLLLKIFLLYRVILAASFLMLFFSQTEPSVLGSHDRQLYIYSSAFYGLITLVSAALIKWRPVTFGTHTQWLMFSDIVLITLIMHASGGIVSGVGVLMSMSMAAAGLLIGGRCALVFAAIGSMALLGEQVYAHLNNSFPQTAYAYTGMLGAALFTIALLSVILAKRTEQSHRLTLEQQRTIDRLERLNHSIVEHLQSGLIVCDGTGRIIKTNQAAQQLVGIDSFCQMLSELDAMLVEAWQRWRDKPDLNITLVTLLNQEEVQLRFSELNVGDDFFYLIIVEDNALYNQRLQQTKLASLGQMSASIAHEIRNPLGAISHAAQLLLESPDLNQQDLKLCGIIQTHSHRLNRIIEDILQLSRKSRTLAQVKLELNAHLKEFSNNFIQENRLEPTALLVKKSDKPIYIRFDSSHLQQILDNLCQNALRYGQPETGPIEIAATNSMGQPCLEVIDQGKGIPLAVQKRLFEPFFTTSRQGTGLGLYLSRTLAELNQARLSYDTTAEGQTCFRLSLSDGDQFRVEL